ncbi:MAG: hypothetical protein QM783_09755 [Phycisphaerales bacterium]
MDRFRYISVYVCVGGGVGGIGGCPASVDRRFFDYIEISSESRHFHCSSIAAGTTSRLLAAGKSEVDDLSLLNAETLVLSEQHLNATAATGCEGHLRPSGEQRQFALCG